MKEFNFEEWRQLAVADPQAFEKKRRQAVEQMINAVPAKRQQRLRGVQWRVDMVRRKYPDPKLSAQHVFNMMWDAVYAENGLLDALRFNPEVSFQPLSSQPATVLAFAKPS